MDDQATQTAAATPAAATPAPEPKPAASSKILSTILGLTGSVEEKTPPVEPAKPDKVEQKPEPKKDDKVEPAVKTEPPPAEKPVPVKRREKPAPVIPSTDDIRRIAAEEAAKTSKPAPAVEKEPPTKPDDSEFLPEQQEDIELAAYAEEKDTGKKGLADKLRAFYRAEKEWLAKRTEEEGEEYDPSSDPKYKAWLAKHKFPLSAAEKKRLFADRITEQATVKAQEKFAPELKRLERKALELEHAPKIESRVDRLKMETFRQEMPKELVEYYEKNGQDEAKFRAAYPEEYEIVVQTLNGSQVLAREFLSLRRGIKDIDPNNEAHKFLDKFVQRQADAILQGPREKQIRNGKTFVHPWQWAPDMATDHWTLEDEDVLECLRVEAGRQASQRIESARARQKAIRDAEALRSVVPTGATPPVASPATTVTEPPVTSSSTRSAPVPAPGNADTPPVKPSVVSRLLGL